MRRLVSALDIVEHRLPAASWLGCKFAGPGAGEKTLVSPLAKLSAVLPVAFLLPSLSLSLPVRMGDCGTLAAGATPQSGRGREHACGAGRRRRWRQRRRQRRTSCYCLHLSP